MTHGDGCRREERTSHVVGRTSIADDVPTLGSIHHAVVMNVRPFGLFVELPGFRRNGLVHNSQISEDVVFSREDADDVKVKAMEYFAPKSSQVMTRPQTGHPLAPSAKANMHRALLLGRCMPVHSQIAHNLLEFSA